MTGTLSVVSTPIGNLEDITLRAIRTLKEADLVAAEDTRRAAVLMKTYGAASPVTSFHAHNGKKKTRGLIKALREGKNIALISDSGTPGISDPGYILIKECITENIKVVSIPGPTALIAALVLSGKPASKFVFEGFLSNKSGRRKKQLEALAAEERTVVVYESPHRIEKMMKDMAEIAPGKEVVIAREMTKKFEEIKRGTAGEHLARFAENRPRGEYVVVF